MSDLHLHVKSEYFEAIKHGRKTEEYRLYKDYWIARLGEYIEYEGKDIDYFRTTYEKSTLMYDRVVIHNAYKQGKKNRLSFPWLGWDIKTITHPHFGLEPVKVFAIKLEK